MYDRTNIRSHWPLLSYINKPVSSLKQRLETHTYADIEPFLFYDPVKDENGVETTFRHMLNNLHGLYVKLSTIYCSWENNGEYLSDIEIRKLIIGMNYEIYETYLHLLKLASIFLPAVRANSGMIDNFRNTLIDYMYRAGKSFPEEYAVGLTTVHKSLAPNEAERLLTGAEIPEIILERQFIFHHGTTIDLDRIETAVNLREHLNTEHPSVGRILELARIIEITISEVNPDEFTTKPDDQIQDILTTLLYAFGRWTTYTVATLLKDDQMLRTMYDESDEKLSFQNYRDVQIANVIDPLLITSTSIN